MGEGDQEGDEVDSPNTSTKGFVALTAIGAGKLLSTPARAAAHFHNGALLMAAGASLNRAGSSYSRARVLDRPEVRSEKQVAHGAAQQIGDPPLRQVMRTIVDQMAALSITLLCLARSRRRDREQMRFALVWMSASSPPSSSP